MVQEIVVYIILAGAIFYAGFKLYKFIRYPSTKCAHCCKECPYAKKSK